jgi:D-glycero-beta-D-manno-heptose 1-phosphate adenylyltransferase
MSNNQQEIDAKIFALHQHEPLNKLVKTWRHAGKKIVFTNGCFDILHPGHVDYLAKASGLGDVLVVGLNTDASVSAIKGPDRPLNDEKARAVLLASLFFTDAVVLFDEETPYELIKQLQPDILVKGSDYKAEEIVGYDLLKKKGGQVITIDLLPGYSTTNLIQKIRKLRPADSSD